MPEPDNTPSNKEPTPTSDARDATIGGENAASQSSVAPDSIEGLFLQALQIDAVEDRDAFLHDRCGNADQRQRVSALLRAYNDAGSFLETPAGGAGTESEVSLSFLKPVDKDGVLGSIGAYEVLDVIGRGGMGVVLRAVDLKLNRVVAVKALLPELAANPNSRRRFLREAQAAAAISHPHVVTIHAVDDVTQDIGGKSVPPYLVMECVVGQSLQQKLDHVGTLRLAEILRISRQIAEGLGAAHRQGLIHRDIKPANILLENGIERVKITDFGLARAIDDITVTRTGEVCGTPQYMSPEQAGGERVDHRSDLFSLGCVMYAMCTGHSPFRGDSIAHVIKRVTQDPPRPIVDQNPEIPPWLTEIINCLLQKNAEHRFESADGVVAILDQHLARIQHPTESGTHKNINQQIPGDVGNSASPLPNQADVPSSGLASPFATGSPKVLVPGWMRSLSRIWLLLAVTGTLVMLYVRKVVGVGIGETAVIMSLGGLGPAVMSGILMRKTLSREVMAIALFIGLGPIGLLLYLIIKDQLQAAPVELPPSPLNNHPRPVAAAGVESVDLPNSSQHARVIPASATKLAFVWLVTTLLGSVFAAFLNPQVALEIGHDSVLQNAFMYPAMLMGIWVLQMFANLILNSGRMPMRQWALFSSACFISMAFGFFWATVLRMPTPPPDTFATPRNLISAALLPSMIWLSYCCYVGLELRKNCVAATQLTPPDRKNTKYLFLASVVLFMGSLGASTYFEGLSASATDSTQQDEWVAPVETTPTDQRPVLVLKHPELGCEVRNLMINRGGSTHSFKTPTETEVYLEPELLGASIGLHVILMDGREWVGHGIRISQTRNNISIDNDDLKTPDRSLVEVMDDAPGFKLRMINYPTQNVSVNEFYVSKPPFHKALQPGQHRIVVDYRIVDEEILEGMVRWYTLDYRVTVPDTQPIKLSLKQIIEEHGSEAKPHQARRPDFQPPPKNAESA